MTEANGSTQKCANVSGITTGAAENCVCVCVCVCLSVCLPTSQHITPCVPPHILLSVSYLLYVREGAMREFRYMSKQEEDTF